MKNPLLAVIAILSVIPFISKAQWTSGGSGNYYINSGYASIGTMNFLHPLTVSNGSSGSFLQTQIGLYNPYTSNADIRNWMIATDEYAYGSLAFKTSTSQGGNPSSSGITRLLIDKEGKIGVGTTSPQSNLHIVGVGTSIDAYDQFTGGGLIVQGNTNSRSSTLGAQLEFVIPANTDGSNLWGQARIITVAGNTGNGDATGKMILGTRRYYNKQNIAGQWYYGNDIVIDGAGKIGIGTTNPSAKLDVANNISIGAQGGTDITTISGGAGYGSVLKMYYADGVENIRLAGNNDSYLNVNHGNVAIGTTDAKGYKLAVNGSVIATSMTVKLYANWPDYVFKPTYKLPSLASVKAYIDKNQHLPEIPSEQEITKNGLDLGEMNKLLMKKVEELTLYLLEQDKVKKEQEQRITKLEDRLNTISQNLPAYTKK